jgi:type II secretory pathway pseudopilin PulG
MIELAVVILILAILGGMIAPAVATGLRRTELRAGAAETASALRRARNLAVTWGEIYRADRVSGAPDAIDVYRADDLTDTGTATEDYAGGAALPDDVTLGGASPIYFLPDGSAWVSGGAQPRVEIARPHAGSVFVTVRPLTGRIEVKR